ncbi:hypothetical protein CC2G_002251 [Coprinopsis cinerea AmutBmut pab1-1]|nr:hypothetical protein CC2G_002251 [Coprinopsis cinerea AmutBmut pab1-1]
MSYFVRAQSTPVKIARPPTTEPESPKQSAGQTRKDSVQRQCRNIVIYGHCKYQDKGCIYYHPPTEPEPPAQAPPPSTGGTRPESPVVTGTLSAQAVNAPVFVPKSASAIAAGIASAASTPAATTDGSTYDGASQSEMGYQEYDQSGYENYTEDSQMEGVTQKMEDLSTQYYGDYSDAAAAAAAAAYYAAAPPVFLRQPLNYHLYTPTAYPDFQPSTVNTHFVPPSADLRQTLQERSETIRGIAPPGLNLPEELQGYHTLVPLEPTGPGTERRKFGNWYCTVYRAIKASDGLPYVLRRIENYRLIHTSAFAPIEFWSNLKHPGIVSLKEAFTTRSFDDNSLVVVYAYHPNAKTLYDTYLKQNKQTSSTSTTTGSTGSRFGRYQSGTTHYTPQASPAIGQGPAIPERTIWSYIVQIATAIKRVHEAGHALRGLDASKVIITGQNRIRISACGTMDVLMHDVPQDIHLMQQEDLTQFGRLIFALCCGSTNASSGPHFQKSVDHLLRVYGQEIKSLALWLISKQTMKVKCIHAVVRDCR